MPLSLEQILAQEERLKKEIADRKTLLAAPEIARSQVGKSDCPSPETPAKIISDAPPPPAATTPPPPAR